MLDKLHTTHLHPERPLSDQEMLRHDGYLEVVSIACGMVAGTTLLSIGAASTRSIDLTSNKLISRGNSRAYPHPLQKNRHDSAKSLHSASKLKEAGVKFRVNREGWPLCIKFERGELKMPPFEVQDDTERVLRNFMAYEQCHHPNDHYICDFIWILDFLITAGKDVEVLVQNGIVVNLVGNNIAVAELVNKLGLEITASGACFHELSIELNSHCMRRVYFTNLWRGTGTVAALFLLLLTLAQSIYSIMQIFQ
eukprot:XP_025015344.1 uncharacterized protein LOC112536725 [Ricinus communis]